MTTVSVFSTLNVTVVIHICTAWYNWVGDN